ncbi:hypothetical protein IC582_008053 [Cucumis melo]
MLEFVPICIYLLISPLVSLTPLDLPFPIASNSSTYPEKLLAYECGFDPSGDAKSRFIFNFVLFPFYLLSLIRNSPFPFLG